MADQRRRRSSCQRSVVSRRSRWSRHRDLSRSAEGFVADERRRARDGDRSPRLQEIHENLAPRRRAWARVHTVMGQCICKCRTRYRGAFSMRTDRVRPMVRRYPGALFVSAGGYPIIRSQHMVRRRRAAAAGNATGLRSLTSESRAFSTKCSGRGDAGGGVRESPRVLGLIQNVIAFILIAALLSQAGKAWSPRATSRHRDGGLAAAREIAPKGVAVALLGPVNARLKELDAIPTCRRATPRSRAAPRCRRRRRSARRWASCSRTRATCRTRWASAPAAPRVAAADRRARGRVVVRGGTLHRNHVTHTRVAAKQRGTRTPGSAAPGRR